MRRLLPALLLLFITNLAAQPAQPLTRPQITLSNIMADPDWIGPGVESAWWSWDGKQAYYTLKRDGSSVRDTWSQAVIGSDAAVRLDGAALAQIDGARQVVDPQHKRMAFVRNGDLFVRDLGSGTLTQVTRTEAADAQPQWGHDGTLVWRSGNDWFGWSAATGTMQASNLKTGDDPAKPPKDDALQARQLRLIDTLRNDKAQRDAAREQQTQWRQADPFRAPAPAYLGKDVEIVDSALSPSGLWLVVVTQAKDGDAGRADKVPEYVTESGYAEVAEARTLVGHNAPLPQTAWLVEVASGRVRELKYDDLPGIQDDPLAALRKAAGKDPLKGNRALQVLTAGDNSGPPSIHWSDDGRNVALMLRAIDNKDRWIATVNLANARLVTRHRLHDDAWINWNFNDFGWMPDGRTLWLLSEQSGYSQLYQVDGSGAGGGKARTLTSGKWEVSSPELARDGHSFYFLCNRNWPGDYELCNVSANGGQVRELTSLDGVEGFVQSPRGDKLLVQHSRSYVPSQLAVADAEGKGLHELTDTRKPAFKAIDWLQPQYVQVPSKHGAGTVWGKYYAPKQMEAGKQYPIVMFVHGAGYLQNVHARYPAYFREQMFHNLLVQQGYIVLDLDYRGSEGYGRDWRTAIYRNMGHPELDDYLDGLDWLVANHQGDRDRAGIYGGSYGGFMTFMALFRSPGTFKAGAALRPVADWTQYNHEYTSNILNTPDIDPEAYKVSSPIEYAAGLQDNLLIAHGMIDDNVFFRDSVMLTQKLIELRKDKWELAPYPLEKHGFVHPDSWFDEYRRIDELFERVLAPH